jgi:Cu/Ag efflux protein CusF
MEKKFFIPKTRIIVLLVIFSLAVFSGIAVSQHHHGSHGGSGGAAQNAYSAEGVVKALDDDSITISHGPIPELRWGPMVMTFLVPDPALLQDVQAGDKVRFVFTPRGRTNIIIELEVI